MDIDDSNDTDELSNQERLIAILGLLADGEKPPAGARPDLKEIQDWHSGNLDEIRTAEIRTHVARDPDCYQMWSELLACEAKIKKEQAIKARRLAIWWTKIKNWILTPGSAWAGRGLATAMVIVLAVILILPEKQPDWSPTDHPVIVDLEANWPYSGKSISRGGQISYRNKIAFQAGISDGITLSTQANSSWAQTLDYLHDTPEVCADDKERARCEAQNRIMRKTGLHASVLLLACLERETKKKHIFNDKFWINQSKAWKYIGNDLADNNIHELSEFAYRLNHSANSRDAQCHIVRDLINAAY
ncbi:MAG TPA: hypothetical protein ENJ08_00265 [Gammaproteobacteria bacterium]|nr:hypothetical protein [Gammaproteobacteria bacterium]